MAVNKTPGVTNLDDLEESNRRLMKTLVERLDVDPRSRRGKQRQRFPLSTASDRSREVQFKDQLNEPLLLYLKAKNVPSALLPETAAEIERLVRKKLAAAVNRPQWDDRAKYPELAFLPAPEFLKRVWADQIGPTGEIEKELVRRQDRALMIAVEGYIKNRQRREIDAGAAHGLKLIARGYGGRKPGKKATVTQK